MSKYENITETIGNTPIVRINKLAPEDCKLYAKVEYFNPAGSVKDRIALAMIEDAEEKGLIKAGETTPDGKFSIQDTRCVGACGLAPVMMINDDVHGRLTPGNVEEILAKYE